MFRFLAAFPTLNSHNINNMKRNIFRILLLLSVVLLASCADNRGVVDPDAQQLFIGEDIAVAPTIYGKVKGYILRDIYHFMGIPYGASTEGENRFMSPFNTPHFSTTGLVLCFYVL